MHLTVWRTIAFGKDYHGTAGLEIVQDSPESLTGKSFLIDRESIQTAHEPAQAPVPEEALARQEMKAPPGSEANQHRIEKALMIGDDERGPRGRYLVVAFGVHAKTQFQDSHAHPVTEVIPAQRQPDPHRRWTT